MTSATNPAEVKAEPPARWVAMFGRGPARVVARMMADDAVFVYATVPEMESLCGMSKIGFASASTKLKKCAILQQHNASPASYDAETFCWWIDKAWLGELEMGSHK